MKNKTAITMVIVAVLAWALYKIHKFVNDVDNLTMKPYRLDVWDYDISWNQDTDN